MTTKTYIGNGNAHRSFEDVTEITLHMDSIQDLVFEYEGKRYLKFYVSKRQRPSQYHTHSVYVIQREPAELQADADAIALEYEATTAMQLEQEA